MAWWITAYVGQHVSCVESGWGHYGDKAVDMGCSLPQYRHVYTIREILAVPGYGIGLKFVELVNPKVSNFGQDEPSFDPNGFRPVDPKRIEIFKAMLNRVPVDA